MSLRIFYQLCPECHCCGDLTQHYLHVQSTCTLFTRSKHVLYVYITIIHAFAVRANIFFSSFLFIYNCSNKYKMTVLRLHAPLQLQNSLIYRIMNMLIHALHTVSLQCATENTLQNLANRILQYQSHTCTFLEV